MGSPTLCDLGPRWAGRRVTPPSARVRGRLSVLRPACASGGLRGGGPARASVSGARARRPSPEGGKGRKPPLQTARRASSSRRVAQRRGPRGRVEPAPRHPSPGRVVAQQPERRSRGPELPCIAKLGGHVLRRAPGPRQRQHRRTHDRKPTHRDPPRSERPLVRPAPGTPPSPTASGSEGRTRARLELRRVGLPTGAPTSPRQSARASPRPAGRGALLGKVSSGPPLVLVASDIIGEREQRARSRRTHNSMQFLGCCSRAHLMASKPKVPVAIRHAIDSVVRRQFMRAVGPPLRFRSASSPLCKEIRDGSPRP